MFEGQLELNAIGHIGFTLAGAVPAEYLIRRVVTLRRGNRHAEGLAAGGVTTPAHRHAFAYSFFDFRLVMIGSVIPDLLDKPIGFFLAPELVNNNLRTFGHGGLFALAVLALALAATYFLRNPQLIVMAGASMGHLVMDQMWLQKRTLLWPALGLEFRRGTTTLSEYITFHIHGLLRPELLDYAAWAVILGFLAYVVFSSSILSFITTGRLRAIG